MNITLRDAERIIFLSSLMKTRKPDKIFWKTEERESSQKARVGTNHVKIREILS